MSFVVELEKCRGVGVVVLQMKIVDFGLRRCVTAVLADIHLCKSNDLQEVSSIALMFSLTFDLLCL